MTSKYRLIRRLANRNKVGDMYAEENSRKKTYTVEQDIGEDQQAEDELWAASLLQCPPFTV